ncbi:hypothetical protein [Spiroplasma endosymbiont of Dilophus febrilis]|uniref:hypothetical protein n=3 Tax=unclassified Spiroplasma TaxID=2637901 RepID=UPI00313EB744
MHHYIPKDDKERNEIIQLINNLENSQNINLSEKINSKRIFEGLKLLEDKKYYQRWPDRNHLLIESYKILLTDVWKKSFEPDFEQTVKFLSKTFDDITSKTVSFLNSSIYSKAECLQWMEQGEELSKRSISITLYLMPEYEHATHSHKKQLKVAYSKFQKFIDDKKYEKICDILDKYSLFQRSSKLNNSFRRKNIISKYVNKIVTDEEVSFIDCLRKKCKLFSENGTRSRLYIMPLISHQNKVKEELFPKQEDNLKLIQPVYQEVLIGANNKKNKRDSKSDVIDFSHLSSQEELCISEIDNNEKQQKRKEKAESLKKQYNEISE